MDIDPELLGKGVDSVTTVVGKLELGSMVGAESGVPGKLLLDPSVTTELGELMDVTAGRVEAEVLWNVVDSAVNTVVREL